MYYVIQQISTGEILASGKLRTHRKREGNMVKVYESTQRAHSRAWKISRKTGIPISDMILKPRLF